MREKRRKSEKHQVREREGLQKVSSQLVHVSGRS